MQMKNMRVSVKNQENKHQVLNRKEPRRKKKKQLEAPPRAR
jgi:hypothetical protein